LQVLQWAHDNGALLDTTGKVLFEAAKGGHLEVLQWLVECAGCSWDYSWKRKQCLKIAEDFPRVVQWIQEHIKRFPDLEKHNSF
jgi:hypothetical protein